MIRAKILLFQKVLQISIYLYELKKKYLCCLCVCAHACAPLYEYVSGMERARCIYNFCFDVLLLSNLGPKRNELSYSDHVCFWVGIAKDLGIMWSFDQITSGDCLWRPLWSQCFLLLQRHPVKWTMKNWSVLGIRAGCVLFNMLIFLNKLNIFQIFSFSCLVGLYLNGSCFIFLPF